MEFRSICFSLLALILAGCANKGAPEEEADLYFWISAPEHYDVWVEHLRFERSGEYAWHQAPGGISCCWRGPNGPAGAGGRLEAFPNYIGVQWFSYSEQKFYQRLVSVRPEWRQQMAERVPVKTHLKGVVDRPRNRLVIGLAPGGAIVVWMMNRKGSEVELDRLQANEIEGDPSDYRRRSESYFKDNGDYLDKHGIPLTGW